VFKFIDFFGLRFYTNINFQIHGILNSFLKQACGIQLLFPVIEWNKMQFPFTYTTV